MKTAKPAVKNKSSSKAKSAKSAKTTSKKPAVAAGLPKLEPDHPNFDTILLRRARLETYRERRRKNRPDLAAK
jgi:hypothetical protein